MATKIKSTSSNQINISALLENCPVNLILTNISARWKMQILYHINEGETQFSKLKKRLPTLADQVLSQRLHELENDRLILKDTIQENNSIRVHYTTTKQAKELLDIIKILCRWGSKFDFINLVDRQLLPPE